MEPIFDYLWTLQGLPNPPQTLPKTSQDPAQSDQKSTLPSNSFLERLFTPYVPSRGCPKPPKTSPKTFQHGVKIDKKSMSKNNTFFKTILDGFGAILDLIFGSFFCNFLVPSSKSEIVKILLPSRWNTDFSGFEAFDIGKKRRKNWYKFRPRF